MDAPMAVAPARLKNDSTPLLVPTAGALAVTLGIAATCWVVALRQMHGMDMGVATELGSFPSFLAVWVSMMAAMMLPGAVTPVVRLTQAGPRRLAAPRFVGSYLAVWAVVGVIIFATYRPHGTGAAGAVVIAAGVYELTPVKRYFRLRCRETTQSGVGYGLCCVGSSIALMLMLVALGVMSVAWMSVIAGVVVAQKLVPPQRVVDVGLALAIVAFGVFVIVAPASIPGLVPSM